MPKTKHLIRSGLVSALFVVLIGICSSSHAQNELVTVCGEWEMSRAEYNRIMSKDALEKLRQQMNGLEKEKKRIKAEMEAYHKAEMKKTENRREQQKIEAGRNAVKAFMEYCYRDINVPHEKRGMLWQHIIQEDAAHGSAKKGQLEGVWLANQQCETYIKEYESLQNLPWNEKKLQELLFSKKMASELSLYCGSIQTTVADWKFDASTTYAAMDFAALCPQVMARFEAEGRVEGAEPGESPLIKTSKKMSRNEIYHELIQMESELESQELGLTEIRQEIEKRHCHAVVPRYGESFQLEVE